MSRQQSTFNWVGIDRRGVGTTGRTAALDSGVLAKDLYDRGFQSARITNVTGREVGGVTKDDGRRVWWGEHLDREQQLADSSDVTVDDVRRLGGLR